MVETLNKKHSGRVFLDEKEFPDDLEGRMSSVLNGVNTELKTVTLLHLDDRPADHIEIRDRIRDTRGKGYLPQVYNFRGYGETLKDIALVTKQTIVRDDGETQVLGYSLTEAGRQYGVPIAEHVLKWVVDNGLSMYQVLGGTSSKGQTRSPKNRVEILEALSTGETSEVELVDFSGLSQGVVQEHLKVLSKIGFVKFDSIGSKSKGFSTYKWIDGKYPEDTMAVMRCSDLTKRVAEKMSREGEQDCNSLSKMLNYKYVEKVSGILSGLERQGFVRRTTPYQMKVVLSKARILESGERFLEEVVYPVKEHLSESVVLETDFEERDSEYVARGIDIYKKVSPQINKISSQERIQQIRSYLSRNPGTTSREIGEEISLGVAGARLYLRQLSGVRTEREGSEIRYFLNGGSGGKK